MVADFLRKREQALEKKFFLEVDQQLLADLRRKLQEEHDQEALGKALGFQDAELLDHLVKSGIRLDNLTALHLIPLVQVAWSHGHRIPLEQGQAILAALDQQGYAPQSATAQLLSSWLQQKPKSDLFALWSEYIHALHQHLPAHYFLQFKAETLRRSRTVAEAAGGFLGIGKISKEEQQVLDEIESAFAVSEEA